MNVSLPPELESFVAKKVESGMYPTANEVIQQGLLLLRERDEAHQQQMEELRREVAIGIEEADQGRLAPLDAKAILQEVRDARTGIDRGMTW